MVAIALKDLDLNDKSIVHVVNKDLKDEKEEVVAKPHVTLLLTASCQKVMDRLNDPMDIVLAYLPKEKLIQVQLVCKSWYNTRVPATLETMSLGNSLPNLVLKRVFAQLN